MLANYASHTNVTTSLYAKFFTSNQVQIIDGVRATDIDDGLIFVVIDRVKRDTFKMVLELEIPKKVLVQKRI